MKMIYKLNKEFLVFGVRLDVQIKFNMWSSLTCEAFQTLNKHICLSTFSES